MTPDLIIDVGMHKGEDTEFYLKKGFRVVAIEANPVLCTAARDRFAEELASGRLILIEGAVTAIEGPVTFHQYQTGTEWGTTCTSFAERNLRMGAKGQKITVPGIRFGDVLDTYGVPYFLKIDIEGADPLCLEALIGRATKPVHVSIESEKISFDALRREFDLFTKLGYRRFKVVNQVWVPDQVCPDPPREGEHAGHSFGFGASGMFGQEAPGLWIPRWLALLYYRWIYLKYRAVGNDAVFPNLHRHPRIRDWKRLRKYVHPGWYDTHATL